jgi:hypothetical protein
MKPCIHGHTSGRYDNGHCRECERISHRKHYRNSANCRRNARVRCRARHDADPMAWNAYNKEYRHKKKAALVLYKGGKCLDCGGEFPLCCYDFDHRNPFEKAFAISAKMGRPLEELKKEADKCDLVCRNCHAIRTSSDPRVGKKISRKSIRTSI